MASANRRVSDSGLLVARPSAKELVGKFPLCVSPNRKVPHQMAYDSRENLETGIVQYLMHCYCERTAARATELATFLAISHRRLTRLCSRLLGAGPKASMRHRQLAYAVSLLREGLVPVDEIALMAGFGDRRTFYRAIRREFGCSPLLLRNAVLNCP